MTSVAKDAVDSTIRKIATYTAEIIASIIILILLCLPIAFTVVGWIQHVLFDVPLSELTIRPVVLFGVDGTVVVTVGLGLLSFILVHFSFKRLLGKASRGVEETEETLDEIEDVTEESDEESTDEEEVEEELEDTPEDQ